MQPQRADRAGFNLGFSLVRIYTSAAQRAAAARLDSHTLRLAVKASGRASWPPYLSLYESKLVSYFNVDIFEDSVYFNDGNEEDCNFTDDQGVEAIKTLHRWRARPSTPMLGPGQKSAPKHPQRSSNSKPEEN